MTCFTNVELGFFSTPPRDEGEKEKSDLSALQDLEKIKGIHNYKTGKIDGGARGMMLL